MNRIFKIGSLIVAMLLSVSVANKVSAQPGPDGDITYQDFYDELSPYGQWVDYPEYGYVWVPSAGPEFQPYSTNGHWVWSDEYEWIWASDYNWGWAPFHYGRWFQDPGYGWMWMPGYEWAPAWVAWRDGGDYYGWAPIRPGFNLSIGFSFGNYNPPIDYWCFAPRRYISSPRIWDYCAPRRQNITIINNTTIINNYGRRGNNVFYNGPRRSDAERFTGRIRSVRLRDASGPGRTTIRRNELSTYRPNIRRDDNRNFTPRTIQRYDRNNNNATVRNNDARPDRRLGNDNRIDRRNDNDRTNNNNIRQPRVNDRPDSDRSNDNRIRDNRINGRTNDNVIRDNRNNTQPGNTDRRIRRPDVRPNTDNNDNNNNGRNDRIDRTPRVQQPNNDRPTRSVELPNNTRPQRNVFEQRNNNSNNDNRRIERRNDVDRRSSNPAPSREFRNDAPVRQPSQPRVQQNSSPRQFENRGGGDRGDRGRRGR